jgi:hypothetical protein
VSAADEAGRICVVALCAVVWLVAVRVSMVLRWVVTAVARVVALHLSCGFDSRAHASGGLAA